MDMETRIKDLEEWQEANEFDNKIEHWKRMTTKAIMQKVEEYYGAICDSGLWQEAFGNENIINDFALYILNKD